MVHRMAKCLYLYPNHGGDPKVFELDPAADPQAVEAALDSCRVGEYATIPLVFSNQLQEVQFRVQPHAWGCWVVVETLVEADAPR